MPDHRPRIAVTPHRYRLDGDMCLHPGYTDSVFRAGGWPIVLPLIPDANAYAEVLDLFDGFLLTGSEADVFPERYGKTPPDNNYSDPERDTQDIVLLDHAKVTGKPVFGVCRGCQMMNVHRGGTLALHYSELAETSIEHAGKEFTGPPAHTVTLVRGTMTGDLVPLSVVPVNSVHRQVCETIGNDLRVTARSEDGLIEGIEDVRHPERYFAVQWHPEQWGDRPDGLANALFGVLVREAARYRDGREGPTRKTGGAESISRSSA
ncbi:MAG: gamma-glutamyl-gamma-aminobutyrate hydrolase family protein [Capsulimonadales bacterium]|nr:gamma-glutamyl-gamma-aminobutyrate hydrolase family protein [Capsulimonadales bacterium]